MNFNRHLLEYYKNYEFDPSAIRALQAATEYIETLNKIVSQGLVESDGETIGNIVPPEHLHESLKSKCDCAVIVYPAYEWLQEAHWCEHWINPYIDDIAKRFFVEIEEWNPCAYTFHSCFENKNETEISKFTDIPLLVGIRYCLFGESNNARTKVRWWASEGEWPILPFVRICDNYEETWCYTDIKTALQAAPLSTISGFYYSNPFIHEALVDLFENAIQTHSIKQENTCIDILYSLDEIKASSSLHQRIEDIQEKIRNYKFEEEEEDDDDDDDQGEI